MTDKCKHETIEIQDTLSDDHSLVACYDCGVERVFLKCDIPKSWPFPDGLEKLRNMMDDKTQWATVENAEYIGWYGKIATGLPVAALVVGAMGLLGAEYLIGMGAVYALLEIASAMRSMP